MIIANHHIDDLENKHALLAHHKLGLQYTQTGYGSRIPTDRMVKIPGNKRWRRVYCCIWSNIGTCYVDGPRDTETGKRSWIVING